MPFYPGGGGGGSGVGDVTADPAITNWDAATDGMFLASNGDTTATFEALPTKGTGAADGWVWTADGANGAGWEAPAGGGSSILTPDGLTTITRSSEFNVRDYGASGSRKIFHVTSSSGTYTTKNAAGTPISHDFRVGQGVMIPNCAAVADVTAPDVAKSTVTQQAITFTAVAGTDIITASVADVAVSGDSIRFTTTVTLPAGLNLATTYYLNRLTSTTYKVYDTEVNALAGGATGLIDITDAGTGTHSFQGVTTYTYKAVAIDADGGRSAASSALTTTTGYETQNGGGYNIVAFDMPRNAVAIAIYKSDILQTVMDTAEPVRQGTDVVPGSFTLTNNAGSIRLTVAAGHGIQTNDYIHIKTTSSGDTGYDVTAQVTTAGATTLDLSGVAYGGSGDATGYFRRAKMEWLDLGTAVLHPIKYLPYQGNAPYAHRPAAAVWPGQLCWATASGTKYLYRATRAVGTRMTGAVAPTWTTDPTVPIEDGEVTWMLEPFFVDVDIPSGAQRKTLFTKIATVPTVSTFTCVDAAGADISTNRLLCAHNDVLAARECLAAAKTYGQPASIYFPAGDYPFYLPSQMNTTYWDQLKNGVQNRVSVLRLNSGLHDILHPTLSIKCDPAATIRARFCQNSQIVEQLGSYADHLQNAPTHFLTTSTDGASIIGGEWEWAPFSGGLTEYDSSGSYGGYNYWIGDGQSGFAANPEGVANGLKVRDVRVRWVSIHESQAITLADSNRKRNASWINCELYYGGGDGDQTFLPHGDFLFDGGLVMNERLYGSHGFYLGVGNDDYKILNSTIKWCGPESSKRAISIRGTGGDTWISNIIIANNTFINTGTINVGDSTTSNRVHRVSITNCGGTGVPVTMAEARNVTISGGVYGAIFATVDCRDIKISDLICDSINVDSSDQNYDVDISNVTFREKITVADCTNVMVSNCRTRNPHVKATNLVSGTYAWTNYTGTNLYYLTNRATGGDPGLSSPTGVMVRDVVSLTATPDLLLNGGTDAWFYGNIEKQTIAISGTPTGGSFTVTYNGNTSGSIAAGATAATVQTALRLLAGLSACYVAQTGSGNNLTYHVIGFAAGSDPPQMTSTSSLTGGTPVITHATPVAYPGFNTLVVNMGDSQRYDPDANPYGTIQTITVPSDSTGLRIGGVVTNAKFKDCQFTSTWSSLESLVGHSATGASWIDVTFEGITTEYTGTTYGDSTTFRMWNFGNTGLAKVERVKIKDCKWIYPARSTSGVGEECRLYIDYGGDLTLEGLDLTSWGSGWELVNGSNVAGVVNVINCRVQTNRATYTVDATANTFTLIASGSNVDLFDSNSQPVMVDISPGTLLPVTSPQIATNVVYWYRNANSKLYASASDASTDTSAIDVTTANGPVTIRTLDASRLALLSGYKFLGDNTEFNVWGMCKGNIWRGSRSATYADISADQNNYQLIPLLEEHRLNPTSASRAITGFDAPGAGSVERQVIVHNVSATQNLTYPNESGSSDAQNGFLCPGAATVTQLPLTSVCWGYDKISQRWRLVWQT